MASTDKKREQARYGGSDYGNPGYSNQGAVTAEARAIAERVRLLRQLAPTGSEGRFQPR